MSMIRSPATSVDGLANILKEKTAPPQSQNQNSKATVRFSPSLGEPSGRGNGQESKVESLSQQSITQDQPSIVGVITVTLDNNLGPGERRVKLRDMVLGLPNIPLSNLTGMWTLLTSHQSTLIAEIFANIMMDLRTTN